MNVIFFEEGEGKNLHPFTLNKPFAELRMGIFSFKDRWQKLIQGKFSYLTKEYLSEKYPIHIENVNLFLNASYFPNTLLIQSLKSLEPGQSLWKDGILMASFCSFEDYQKNQFLKNKIEFEGGIIKIDQVWDLFRYNAYAIKVDYDYITERRASQKISSTNGVFNSKNIFIEEGAVVEHVLLNAKEGPIYIGKDAEVMEGSMLRGSIAICDHAKISMGSKLYSGTTIGPHCKVGGEVNNSILMAYSNKGHDGFLGNSVIGEWCNLGADTNNSNLKNNYSEIKLWNYSTQSYLNTGLQFCGLMMGDFSKSAIATRFNTGTVVGISANIFSDGFPPKFIPSFTWGGEENSIRFELDKSYDAALRMMERRKKILTESDKRILKHIFSELTEY